MCTVQALPGILDCKIGNLLVLSWYIIGSFWPIFIYLESYFGED